jgi:hypothetical protein
MKNIIKITLIAAIALGLSTGRATANDEAAAAIGGFVLGMITGAVIENHTDHVNVSVRAGYGYGHDCRSACSVRHDRSYGHGPRGHWEVKRVRVWVPGRWDVRVNHCGDRIRVYEKGYYTYRKDKVWVSYNDRGKRGYDRGRGYDDDDHGRDRGRDRGYRG